MNVFRLFRKPYLSLNTIEISTDSLVANYSYLRNSSGLEIAPVLKSNAYGHGIGLVGQALEDVKAPFYCVDSIYEAYDLQKQKIRTKILIMGYVDPQNLRGKRLPFSFAVSTKESLLAVVQHQPHAGIHIFVDTGMHREGISMKELPAILTILKAMQHLHIEGLMSHFAASDKYNNVLTKRQVENFEKAQLLFNRANIHPKWIHIANSSGVLNYKKYKGRLGNLARVGIATYGIDPENKNQYLRPVLALKTKLVQKKSLAKGERVGYDFTYTAKSAMQIGILPIGYNDGVDRKLSNKSFVTIKGTTCPIIGLISMNQMAVDITQVKEPKIGDQVIVFSNATNAKNTIVTAAKMTNAIAYTMFVNLDRSIKRILV